MAETKQLTVDSSIKTMETWFSKLPTLPANVREVLVKIAPWVALIFGILGIVASIAATGVLAVLSPMVALGGGLGVAAGGVIGGLLALVGSVLMVMAYPGLRDHKMAGWRWSFWSETVSVVASLIALNLVGAVVGGLIGYYILFQIKSYYK